MWLLTISLAAHSVSTRTKSSRIARNWLISRSDISAIFNVPNPNASDNDNPREQQAKEAEIPNVEFTDESFSQDFNSMSSPNYANIERMLLNLALNHTVLIEKE